MFDLPKDHYTARGIAEQVPAELQTFLWEILKREMAEHPADYLQALKLELDGEGTLRIVYSQNQPACQRLYHMADMERSLPEDLDGRTIFALDDITHITMLFAEDY